MSNDVKVTPVNVSLEALACLPMSCVYAIRSKVGMTIQIFSTVNMACHLGKLVDEIRISGEWLCLRKEIQNTEIVILETDIPKEKLKLRHAYHIGEYRKSGYRFYKDSSPVNYSIDKTIRLFNGRLCLFVSLRNARKDEILIGIFHGKKEMNLFLETHYKDGIVRDVVFYTRIK